MQKYLFLYTHLCQNEKSYEFIPYHYGCFSFQSYADRRRFIELGIIKANDIWKLEDKEEDYTNAISKGELNKLLLFRGRYKNISGNDLIREVYSNHPYYAINSKIASKLMTTKELTAIEDKKPKDNSNAFFTIGYEGQSLENYLNRLITNNPSSV